MSAVEAIALSQKESRIVHVRASTGMLADLAEASIGSVSATGRANSFVFDYWGGEEGDDYGGEWRVYAHVEPDATGKRKNG